MRAELRDAKIAAAKARGVVRKPTTLAERRARRAAEKYAGWRRAEIPVAKVGASQPIAPPKIPPRYSSAGMMLSRKKHGGALRGGRPKYTVAA